MDTPPVGGHLTHEFFSDRQKNTKQYWDVTAWLYCGHQTIENCDIMSFWTPMKIEITWNFGTQRQGNTFSEPPINYHIAHLS